MPTRREGRIFLPPGRRGAPTVRLRSGVRPAVFRANGSFLLPRLEPPRCRKVSVSLIAVSLFRIGGPAIVVGRDKIWVETDRFGKVADRLGVLTLFPIGDSAKIVDWTIIKSQPDHVVLVNN